MIRVYTIFLCLKITTRGLYWFTLLSYRFKIWLLVLLRLTRDNLCVILRDIFPLRSTGSTQGERKTFKTLLKIVDWDITPDDNHIQSSYYLELSNSQGIYP